MKTNYSAKFNNSNLSGTGIFWGLESNITNEILVHIKQSFILMQLKTELKNY